MQSVAANGEARRITANSFRALTARLKGDAPLPACASAPADRVIPALDSEAPSMGGGLASEPQIHSETLPVDAAGDSADGALLAEFPAVPALEPAADPPGSEVNGLPEPDLLRDAPIFEPEPWPMPDTAPMPAADESSGDFWTGSAPAEADVPAHETFATAADVLAAWDEQLAETEAAAEAAGEKEPAVPAASPAEAAVETAAPAEAADMEPAETPDDDASSVAAVTEPVQPHMSVLADAVLKKIEEAVFASPREDDLRAYLEEVKLMQPAEPAAEGAGAAEQAAAEPVPDKKPAAIGQPIVAEHLVKSLAERFGAASPLLRPAAASAGDPFETAPDPEVKAAQQAAATLASGEDTAELARSLLEMMSSGGVSALPQERALAADTLLRLVPRIPLQALVAIGERVAIMEHPPERLVARLIRDPRIEVAGPLLERCTHLSDQDLANAIAEHNPAKQRLIARRRVLSSSLSDLIVAADEPSAVLTLVRNPGAALSHDSFYRLADHAMRHHAVLAPLTTRADLPAPVAFEIFWLVPAELRRYILSRFLTDSETLNKILKITLAMQAQDGDTGEPKFPEKAAIDRISGLVLAGSVAEASEAIAVAGGICQDTAGRIITDRDGEPLTILMKALGMPRSRFEEFIDQVRTSDDGHLRPDRNTAELQSIFDSMSFNKARILLTYWDWAVQKTGPYAAPN